jgi:quinohemoprotein ethanol dehydrogenase
MRRKAILLALGSLTFFIAAAAARGDGPRSVRNDEWPMHGRDFAEQRFSPLTQINASSIGRLGIAWYYDFRDARGVEATPLMVDGVVYVTSAWSVVYALDARTGRERWVFDPKVDHSVGAKTCCDAVNRGVAYADGRVFVGALDGRLIALDSRTGARLWETQTVDKSQFYVITGAPRVARGLVLIGNSGADLGVRGYVSAYHAATGRLAWRFYTVPGDPAKGRDHAASDSVMPAAAKTWTGRWWLQGGGGTVWDSITYDPELDRVYVGVGNGAPWNRQIRSPQGGDNWFLASIVALDRATGHYRWHYQATPGDTWDATATQSMILATLNIDGRTHRVLMQAPKNGFFYVIDRDTGKLLSARNIVPMAKSSETPPGQPISWAYGVDNSTGRPLENREARFENGTEAFVHPVGNGAHGWQPMSFSPNTGLAYLPVQDFASRFATDPDYHPGPYLRASGLKASTGIPQDARIRASLPASLHSRLIAWNPVTQTEAWRVPFEFGGNGGTLVTAGDLVFESTGGGEFVVYDARTGARLWSTDIQSVGQGGPISYAIDGEQYVAVACGNGGSNFLAAAAFMPERPAPAHGRIVAFKLDATGLSLPAPEPLPPVPQPPQLSADAATVQAGARRYAQYCAGCHGFGAISGHVTPDLRRSSYIQDANAFRLVMEQGLLSERGMPPFGLQISAADAEALRAYIVSEARFIYRSPAANAAPVPQNPE